MGEGQTIDCGENKILKLYEPEATKADAEEEARITRLVRHLGIPAPFVHGVVERDGRWGVVFDNIIGPSYLEWMMDHKPSLEKMTRYFAFVHHEMQLHQTAELPSLKTELEKSIMKAKALSEGQRHKAIAALKRLPEGGWLCHGNFHPLNVIVALDGPVIMDWPRATQGYHLADVVNTSLILELGALFNRIPEGKMEKAREILEPFHRMYLLESIKIYGKPDEEVLAWRGPIAAARLANDSPEEREQLLAIVESAFG